ncbi:cysteine desulfurase [Candidatus Wolfebacteria bacterium]|nr:cysteine desulfurase [Candidatus Wolfebacteria bacterium]
MKKIYFDYAASTSVDPAVFSAMKPYFSEKFGNPGSLHFFGQEAIAAVDDSREKIAKAIGAPPAGGFREIVFTGSATEANNLALRGVVKNFYKSRAVAIQKQNNFAPAAKFSSPSARHFRFAKNQAGAPAGCSSWQSALNKKISPLRIIVSAIEHESILETCRDLEKEGVDPVRSLARAVGASPKDFGEATSNGVEIIYLPVNRDGVVDLKKLKESLNDRTVLVSIMCANNEIGTIQPIAEISKIIKNFKAKMFFSPYPLFHTDAVQAFQFLDCDVNKLGVDLMTLSAHKIYGPKGIGLLYLKAPYSIPYTLNPIITGGGQEFGLRSGTENVPSIVGFAKAVELADKNRLKEAKRIGELSIHFFKELKKINSKIQLNGISKITNYKLPTTNLPNILNIYFPNYQNSDFLVKLDLAGVAVSAGAACSARAVKPSYVLAACGFPQKRIKSSLRFSFGKFVTKAEIDESLKRIKTIIGKQ